MKTLYAFAILALMSGSAHAWDLNTTCTHSRFYGSTCRTSVIADQIGFSGKPNYGPPREGDIRHSLADISRATQELGYRPKTQFHDGLRKTVAWYLEEKAKKETVGVPIQG